MGVSAWRRARFLLSHADARLTGRSRTHEVWKEIYRVCPTRRERSVRGELVLLLFGMFRTITRRSVTTARRISRLLLAPCCATFTSSNSCATIHHPDCSRAAKHAADTRVRDHHRISHHETAHVPSVLVVDHASTDTTSPRRCPSGGRRRPRDRSVQRSRRRARQRRARRQVCRMPPYVVQGRCARQGHWCWW